MEKTPTPDRIMKKTTTDKAKRYTTIMGYTKPRLQSEIFLLDGIIESFDKELQAIQWQPIESAPKHGGTFLVFYTIGKIRCYHLANWDHDGNRFIYNPGVARKPTHFQHLTQPPTDS